MTVLTVLATGCDGAVGGTPQVSRVEIPGPAGLSSTELDDPGTIDLCALVDTENRRRLGSVTTTLRSFDECVLHVGRNLDLTVGPFRRLGSGSELVGATVVRSPPLRIVKRERDGGSCARDVLFDDLVILRVHITQRGDGAADQDLCPVADAVATAATRAFGSRPLDRVHLAANSLGPLEPCLVTPPDAVAAVPDLHGTPPVASPGRHECSWGLGGTDGSQGTSSDGEPARLVVTFSAGPAPVPGTGGRVENIAGRMSSITAVSDGSARCIVETAHIPFPDGGSGAVERATVVVRAADADTACGSARSVAQLAWPALPRP